MAAGATDGTGCGARVSRRPGRRAARAARGVPPARAARGPRARRRASRSAAPASRGRRRRCAARSVLVVDRLDRPRSRRDPPAQLRRRQRAPSPAPRSGARAEEMLCCDVGGRRRWPGSSRGCEADAGRRPGGRGGRRGTCASPRARGPRRRRYQRRPRLTSECGSTSRRRLGRRRGRGRRSARARGRGTPRRARSGAAGRPSGRRPAAPTRRRAERARPGGAGARAAPARA